MSKKSKITAEDFDAWRGNAITQAVMGRIAENAEEVQAVWAAMLQTSTQAEPLSLVFLQVELRTRLEVLQDFHSIELSDIAEEEENADSRIGQIAAKAAAQAKGRAH